MRSLYRPYFKQWMYFNRRLNARVYQMPRILPGGDEQNIAIMVKQRWPGSGQLALIVDQVCELQTDGGTQCFPLYLYDVPTVQEGDGDLFGATAKPQRRDAITDGGLAHFTTVYPGEAITKEDLFYYVYGILHSADYRERFADNLAKELPRIPRVKRAADFRAFSQAGRDLAKLHLGYESVPP